jgi:hypothetical protein
MNAPPVSCFRVFRLDREGTLAHLRGRPEDALSTDAGQNDIPPHRRSPFPRQVDALSLRDDHRQPAIIELIRDHLHVARVLFRDRVDHPQMTAAVKDMGVLHSPPMGALRTVTHGLLVPSVPLLVQRECGEDHLAILAVLGGGRVEMWRGGVG